MGKASKRKSKKTERNQNFSRLDAHKKEGSILIPPFKSLNMHHMSWTNDSAPEMLWAFLVASLFDRRDYLDCFREIAKWSSKKLFSPESPIDVRGAVQLNTVPDQTRLSELSFELLKEFVEIIALHPLGYAALRPLLLYKSLPGRTNWQKLLQIEPYTSDWETVRKASIEMFDHQSEVSTDIRWLKVLTNMLSEKIKFLPQMENIVEEVFNFPRKGDLRMVRPLIRSMEGGLRQPQASKWVIDFWTESYEKTDCIDPTSMNDYPPSSASNLSPKQIMDARLAIISGFHDHTTTTGIDARLEGVTSLCLYGIALIFELQFYRTDSLITGRLILRTLVEACITLKYLVVKNNDALWMSWRVYGNGQAKLAFLKAEEYSEDVPSFIEPDDLEALANEDHWMEFQSIDVGHWDKSTLRNLAIDAGMKDIYDRYYQWTSTFSHGHWCATRDVNFINCHNPLHRVHRIPRLVHRSANSVLEDAVSLMNLMVDEFENFLGESKGTIQRLTLQEPSEGQESKPEPQSN